MIQQEVKSKILSIKDSTIPEELLVACAAVLAGGGIVVAPTETRYGMLAKAFETPALEKLYKIKGRPENMPMAVFVPSVAAIEEYAVLPEKGHRLARAFLPGPLTLVLHSKCAPGSPIVQNGKIGIRVSSAGFIQALLKFTAFPLTATSANSSGGKELSGIPEIYDLFGDAVDLYVEHGTLDAETSTVVEVTEESLRVLREGAITEKEILKITG